MYCRCKSRTVTRHVACFAKASPHRYSNFRACDNKKIAITEKSY